MKRMVHAEITCTVVRVAWVPVISVANIAEGHRFSCIVDGALKLCLASRLVLGRDQVMQI
jgi:hypothetical protein